MGALWRIGAKLKKLRRNFFRNLFSSQDGVVDRNHIISSVHQCFSEDDNVMHTTPYRADKVVQALKGMGSAKALGMDGFSALFFKNFGEL